MHENPDYFMPVSAQTIYLGQLEYYGGNSGIEKHAEELEKEFKAGAAVDVTWACVVGRKAS